MATAAWRQHREQRRTTHRVTEEMQLTAEGQVAKGVQRVKGNTGEELTYKGDAHQAHAQGGGDAPAQVRPGGGIVPRPVRCHRPRPHKAGPAHSWTLSYCSLHHRHNSG